MVHGHKHKPEVSFEQQRLSQRKAAILPWIADPLTHFFHHEHAYVTAATSDTEEVSKTADLEKHHIDSPTGHDTSPNNAIEEIEAEEATPSELFYDLFFVANLTTVTAVHYVTDYQSLVSYILFFIILWFTWLQTTLYDIRFSVDSVYERVIKCVHFAVMIGFASTSLAWNPLDPTYKGALVNLRSMSLTLMASRFALSIQYGVAAFYGFKRRKGHVPLLVHSTVMFVAALGYLGLYFSFNSSLQSYVIWYAIIIVELVVVFASSNIWKIIGFKYTHLVERLGLLTLIILGEGIIVMLKAVNAVEKGNSYGAGWSVQTFGVVGAAIGVIYFLYMFYFDYTPQHIHYGSIRQQVWTVLHFPFHLSVVLAVEGLRQLSTYWSFRESADFLNNKWMQRASSSPQAHQVMISDMSAFFKALYDDGTAITIVKNFATINDYIDTLAASNGTIEDTTATAKIDEALVWLHYYLNRGQAEYYGIKLPKSKTPITYETLTGAAFSDPGYPVTPLYFLVWRYFFIALGTIFFMFAIMGLFVRRKKDVWDYTAVAFRIALGIAFCFMERIQANGPQFEKFLSTPFPIPMVCLVLLFVLVVDKLFGLLAFRRTHSQMRR
ncbi:bacterial low temperature requirement A protein-domain-containing protein [Sphaerosporella brunnea]|uniref:Bacterial low temperature requirement A protein-domain-containing protein n=1 Tax=Sphaerosporella brunnea TaxID=1250544 RepID=A0A5J5EXA5_9PEZI|nr:bacterial low temperature requirement A protein-domain-containing protein [Sphaerosporella brunnea]